MRYGMKKLFVFIIILAAVIHPVQASVVDQSQEQSDLCWLVICSYWHFAQTFTAGMDGQLEKIELDFTNFLLTELYPCTVSIVNVIDGVPSGSVLGEVPTGPLTHGLNSVNFLFESIYLTSGVQYGIVINNDDSREDPEGRTLWHCTTTDVYDGGSAWAWMPGSGWIDSYQYPDGSLKVETFYDKDAVFTTYMVPEPASIILLGFGGLALLKKNKLR